MSFLRCLCDSCFFSMSYWLRKSMASSTLSRMAALCSYWCSFPLRLNTGLLSAFAFLAAFIAASSVKSCFKTANSSTMRAAVTEAASIAAAWDVCMAHRISLASTLCEGKSVVDWLLLKGRDADILEIVKDICKMLAWKKNKSELGGECNERGRKAWETPYIAPILVLTHVTSHTLPKHQEINFRLFYEPSEMTFRAVIPQFNDRGGRPPVQLRKQILLTLWIIVNPECLRSLADQFDVCEGDFRWLHSFRDFFPGYKLSCSSFP